MQSQCSWAEHKADQQQPKELITKELQKGLICANNIKKQHWCSDKFKGSVGFKSKKQVWMIWKKKLPKGIAFTMIYIDVILCWHHSWSIMISSKWRVVFAQHHTSCRSSDFIKMGVVSFLKLSDLMKIRLGSGIVFLGLSAGYVVPMVRDRVIICPMSRKTLRRNSWALSHSPRRMLFNPQMEEKAKRGL